MTQERIDVEVTDKVDGAVETKLRGIADASDKADSAVARLKAQLAAISGGPVQQLKAAMTTVTSTINSELNATARLRASRDASAVSDLKAATNKERLAKSSSNAAIAAAKEATAISRSEEAASRAALAALRLADAEDASAAKKAKAASASAALTAKLEAEASAANKAAEAANRPIVIHDRTAIPQAAPKVQQLAAPQAGNYGYDSAAVNVGNAAKEASREIDKLAEVSTSRFARIKAAAINTFDTTRDAINHWVTPRTVNETASGLDKLATNTEKAGAASGRSRANMANLAAQIQDIGVSLAGGQNPLLVFIQQGSQISYIAGQMEGGFRALTVAALRMLAPFLPLAAAVAGLYYGFKSFTNDIATSHKPELEKYANSLGLTEKEMRKLGDTTVGANGKLKSFDTVTITMGDSWKGFTATVKEGLEGLLEPFGGVSNFFKSAWDGALSFARNVFVGFYGIVVGGLRALGLFVIDTIPRAFKYAFEDAANSALTAVEWLVNKSVHALNAVGGWVNTISEKAGLGKTFDTLTEVSLPKFETSGRKAVKALTQLIGEEVPNATREADRTLRGFSQRWEANSVKAAKDRIKAAADALKDNRNAPRPKKEADPKTQGDYLTDENKKLDDQLSRMKMLKDAREVQQQLDQIEEGFLKRRMPLDKAQIEGFRSRLEAIQQYKYQQAEMDRIYENSTGPLRTYNAAVNAAIDLLKRGALSQAQFNEEVNRAGRAYAEATDPLFGMKEALTAAEGASKLYGDAVTQNAYAEQVRQAFLAKGIDLTKNATAAQIAEAKAIMDRNTAASAQQYVQQTVGEIVNPMLEQDKLLSNKQALYAEIDRLRQADVLKEGEAAQARYALDAKFNAIRLSGAESFFDNLSQLSQSKNSELAAIGKAAAVISATIKGYEAVQNTLATIPPPFNIPAAAAMAAVTGVQVANILSTPTNVGSFNNGTSFVVNGQHGIDQNTIAMNVSHGERVSVETPGQQAAKDNRNGERPERSIKIVNVTDKRDVHAAMGDSEGERVILNVIRRNPKAVKAITQ